MDKEGEGMGGKDRIGRRRGRDMEKERRERGREGKGGEEGEREVDGIRQ